MLSSLFVSLDIGFNEYSTECLQWDVLIQSLSIFDQELSDIRGLGVCLHCLHCKRAHLVSFSDGNDFSLRRGLRLCWFKGRQMQDAKL